MLEDNSAVQEHLSDIIRKTDFKTSVFSFDNVKDASLCMLEKKIDLFLVDIILDASLPGDSSGLRFIETARKISRYVFTPIIIVTSLQDPKLYAYEKLHCYGFVEKPFDAGRVRQLVEQALYFPGVDKTAKTLYFRKDGITLAVECEDIVFAESINHVLHIHTRQNDVMRIPYITIKRLLEEADSHGLMQCSRNTVVNKKYIQNTDFTNRMIQLKNEMGKVEIGITYKNSVRERFR